MKRIYACIAIVAVLLSVAFYSSWKVQSFAEVISADLDAAAEAIRTTEEKTYLIARQCGYEDPNYFSYVFKRHFGVTPTKYRSEGK